MTEANLFKANSAADIQLREIQMLRTSLAQANKLIEQY